MLSRRGVRIAVMKRLYSLSRDESLSIKSCINAYQKAVTDTYDLYFFCLYSLVKITRVAVDDEEKRKAKYLPSPEDKLFKSKLYFNPIIQSLETSKKFSLKADKLDFKATASKDFATQIYNEFQKEESYLNYLKVENTNEEHLDMILELFRFCRKNEYFNDIMEDWNVNWIDDKSLVIGTVKKTLKACPTDEDIFSEHLPDTEITEDFGLELLKHAYQEDGEMLDYIKPILENWDHERLAIIDMILIKMALVEFLYFKTIPVKVTLNEYVEISKTYSTPKSKEFINGILDKLLKQLLEDKKIDKEGRGLLD